MGIPRLSPRMLRTVATAWLLVLASCRTVAPTDVAADVGDSIECASNICQSEAIALREARRWAVRAGKERSHRGSTRAWLRCATEAYLALRSPDADITIPAAALTTRCTDEFLSRALDRQPKGWSEGSTRVGDVQLDVQFRQLSSYLQPPLHLVLARNVPVTAHGGERHTRPGFGVPVAILTPRCVDTPLCQLLPPEGIFRNATIWIEIESDRTDALPRLVLADPLVLGALTIGEHSFPLAIDTSAAYVAGARTSKLGRLAIWGLLGGNEVGRRAGLYLLEDYDPNKRPLVMIHGLGSSPLIWLGLSNAVWAEPHLRSRYQVWHVVYQTNAPLLVTRRRVQSYLDDAWHVLDPEGDDPARSGMVLVGHSLGGVVARMLCVDSGDVLWDAAFVVPPDSLQADADDRKVIEETFRFTAYPGVGRAIFIAAPHRGSPSAVRWFGRLAQVLIGRRTPEITALRRIARDNPENIRPELSGLYQRGMVNSISTLQHAQPVRLAGEKLMPAAGIPYHTIAGSLPRHPSTDGAVPLDSALLAGAASTLVLPSGHNLHESPEALAEVLRILRE